MLSNKSILERVPNKTTIIVHSLLKLFSFSHCLAYCPKNYLHTSLDRFVLLQIIKYEISMYIIRIFHESE